MRKGRCLRTPPLPCHGVEPQAPWAAPTDAARRKHIRGQPTTLVVSRPLYVAVQMHVPLLSSAMRLLVRTAAHCHRHLLSQCRGGARMRWQPVRRARARQEEPRGRRRRRGRDRAPKRPLPNTAPRCFDPGSGRHNSTGKSHRGRIGRAWQSVQSREECVGGGGGSQDDH